MFLIVANKPLSDNAISVIYIYKCFILNTHNFSTVIGFKVELSIQQRSICNIKLTTYAIKISIALDVTGNSHKKLQIFIMLDLNVEDKRLGEKTSIQMKMILLNFW